MDGDRREPGQRLPPALRGDGPARARRRPALRDAPRARREPGGDRGDRRRVGGAARRRARSTGSSTRPASSAARSTRSPTSSRTRSSRRATCSSSTSTPSSAPYIGPGHRPEVLGHARRGALVGDLGGGQPQRGGLLRPARAHRRRARRAARRRASYERVTICDVGPRDGLQNQPVTLEPAVRAELVDRLAAAGRAADRGRQLRQPEARAADGRRRGGRRRDRAARRASSTPGSR